MKFRIHVSCQVSTVPSTGQFVATRLTWEKIMEEYFIKTWRYAQQRTGDIVVGVRKLSCLKLRCTMPSALLLQHS